MKEKILEGGEYLMDNQYFSGTIMETIKRRRSVRTYNSQRLSDELKKELRMYASTLKGPFKPKVRLELIDSKEILEKTGGKIGTYGVIKGARDYIAAMVEKGKMELEQLGYVLEKFILYSTDRGLGTCWLGGTFKKSQFGKLIDLKDNEMLPIVSPIGYSEDKKSMIDSVMRFAARSNHRKPWNELFFNQNLTPLDQKDTKEYFQAFEAVRLAPSASNKQPWRILKDNKAYHFYLKQNLGYAKGLGFNIQRIDMGIAMCHFEMTLNCLGVKGKWEIESPAVNPSGTEELVYVVSWIEEI